MWGLKRISICGCFAVLLLKQPTYASPIKDPQLAGSLVPALEKHKNIYIDFSGSLSLDNSSEYNTSPRQDINYDNGFGFAASLGYQPKKLPGLRMEAEFSYRNAGISSTNINSIADGSVHTSALMFNTIYDVKTHHPISPYIGVGVGGASIHLQSDELLGNSSASDIVPAFQVLAGLSYEPEAQKLAALYLGYRYFETLNDAKIKHQITNIESSLDQQSHIVELGVRIGF